MSSPRGARRWRPVQRLEAVLSYLLHMDSLNALAVLALLLALLEQLAALPMQLAAASIPAARALTATYFYLVFRKAVVGSRRLPRPRDYRDSWDTLIFPLLQGAIVAAWFWGPLLLCVHHTVGLHDFFERMRLNPLELFREQRAPIYLLLACEMLYVPAGLAATAVERRLWRLLDPLRGFLLVWRTPRAWAEELGVLYLLLLVAFLMHSLAAVVQQLLPIPIVTPLLGFLLTLWVALAQARLWGEFVAEQKPRWLA